jgi:hypothetical protein
MPVRHGGGKDLEAASNIDLRAVVVLARDEDVFVQINGIGLGRVGLPWCTSGQRITSLAGFKSKSKSI